MQKGPQHVSYSAYTDCKDAKLFTIALGGKSMLHSIINHIFYSVIKVAKYIYLKTTECLGKGILC